MPDGVPGAGGVEIGWRLARRAWHHGYATESARAALGVAFGGAGLDEIWSMTAVLNQPSQAVMRRLGMTEVARFDHPRVPPGHPLQPHVTYHLARPQESPPAATRPVPVSQAVARSAHARTRSTATGGTASFTPFARRGQAASVPEEGVQRAADVFLHLVEFGPEDGFDLRGAGEPQPMRPRGQR